MLQALIGEMHRTKGDVSLDSVLLCYSLPVLEHGIFRSTLVVPSHMLLRFPGFIMRLCVKMSFSGSETMRSDIEVIRACNLEHDMEDLPNGELRLERKIFEWCVNNFLSY